MLTISVGSMMPSSPAQRSATNSYALRQRERHVFQVYVKKEGNGRLHLSHKGLQKQQ